MTRAPHPVAFLLKLTALSNHEKNIKQTPNDAHSTTCDQSKLWK